HGDDEADVEDHGPAFSALDPKADTDHRARQEERERALT
ncbi:MAG: hypothetical protein JWM72_3575, partial [Actinomycetia bacterium]|nr:hypothetical protein [Actinomycetes bacterium]